MTTVRTSPQGCAVVAAQYRDELGITPDPDLVCHLDNGRVVHEEREPDRRLHAETPQHSAGGPRSTG